LYTSEKYAPMLPPGIEAWTDSSNNEAYLAGSIGYTHNAASVYANAKQDYPELFEDTYVFETAIGPTGQKLEGGGGGQFNIPRGATHQDVAKQLALHLITPEVFLPISLISAGLFLPAYAGYYEMDEVKSALEADPNLARIGRAQLGDHPGDSWPAEPSPYFDAIAAQNILTDMMAEIITAGATPEQAVANAAARMEQIAEEMGAFA
jgi:multiple sugar transport system substrate-binding protein